MLGVKTEGEEREGGREEGDGIVWVTDGCLGRGRKVNYGSCGVWLPMEGRRKGSVERERGKMLGETCVRGWILWVTV